MKKYRIKFKLVQELTHEIWIDESWPRDVEFLKKLTSGVKNWDNVCKFTPNETKQISFEMTEIEEVE